MARTRGASTALVLLVIVIVALVIVAVLVWSRRRAQVVSGQSGGAPVTAAETGVGATAGGAIPLLKNKPRPTQITFDGCPPEGDGGDRLLNAQKNRVDEGAYVPVALDSVVTLPWPKEIEQKRRTSWSRAATQAVAQYEGLPVRVEGYVAGAKLEGPEAPNCHGADPKYRDFHIWLTDSSSTDRRGSVVVEITPRVRAGHPAWTVAALRRLSREKSRVRVSGWLMMDQEHPDQVGRTRGTIWEVHPVLRFEVLRRGTWVSLDEPRA